jgi:hypothetical protein
VTRSGSCDFSLSHYRELLEVAKAAEYRFAGFDREPEAGDLLIRHDVDLSLDAAVRMAEVEADAGAWSSWFLMTRSVFYNLNSDAGERAIAQLKALGGKIGHHAVWPHIDLDERFEPVVAWHNPRPEYRNRPIAGVTNPMTAPWYEPSHFRSDSNQNWTFEGRNGRCPHDELARAELAWLHLNIHPEIWVYDGATMRETMESLLEAEREARFELMRADRIDLS